MPVPTRQLKKHELMIRCDGRPLNNQLYILEEHAKGKRGRICPIVVCCFETMSHYVAAAGLRCNFDSQSLIYLPPQSVLPLEWAPNIGSQPQYGYMNRSSGDLQPKLLVPTSGAASSSAADESTPLELDQLDVLLRELDSELQGAFQDTHNTDLRQRIHYQSPFFGRQVVRMLAAHRS